MVPEIAKTCPGSNYPKPNHPRLSPVSLSPLKSFRNARGERLREKLDKQPSQHVRGSPKQYRNVFRMVWKDLLEPLLTPGAILSFGSQTRVTWTVCTDKLCHWLRTFLTTFCVGRTSGATETSWTENCPRI